MRFLFLGFDKIWDFWEKIFLGISEIADLCKQIVYAFWEIKKIQFSDFWKIRVRIFVRIWVYKVFRLHVFDVFWVIYQIESVLFLQRAKADEKFLASYPM